MRRAIVVILASLVLIVTSVGVAAAVGGTWKAPPFASIGIKNVYYIGNEYDISGGADQPILRVFMETGSASEACLTSLGEANHAPTVSSIYCSARTPAGHRPGVMVTLFVDGTLDAVDGDPAWYSMNVYQEGAGIFGEPLRCDMEGC
jgi:hypothetical protein